MLLDARHPDAIPTCAQALARGDLVAFPTETVYGLGARADDDAAVARIFEAKGRPTDHPLIVHVLDAEGAEHFAAEWPDMARRLVKAHWPGPLTLIVARHPDRARAAAGGAPTIALRSPSHPAAQALLQACKAMGVAGLAGPSANRFGRVSPTTAQHVEDEFGGTVMVLDGGPCEVGIESAIVDLTRGRAVLLRPGALTAAQIEAGSGVVVALAGDDDLAPRAPGTLQAHYAPQAKLRLMDSRMLARALDLLGDTVPSGLAVYSRTVQPGARSILHRRMPATAREVAYQLFAVLRELDSAGATLIWVEQPPDDASWDGVRDRLQRAAAAA